MTLNDFIDKGISPWMRDDGPDNDIVLSSRIRLARNFSDIPFPTVADEEELAKVCDFFKMNMLIKTF